MKLKNYRPIDYLVTFYILFNLFFFIFGWAKIPNNYIHLTIFIGIGLFIFFINYFYKVSSKIMGFIRDWYQMPLFIYFFESTTLFNRIIFPNFIDHFFQKIDAFIFGYQPALVWGKTLDNFFWQELFHFAYFSYYLIPVLFLVIYFKNRELYIRFAFVVTFVFFVCYVTYNFLPVIGGRWWEMKANYPVLTIQYRYGIFTRIMAAIYRGTTHQGGAFPSSHVAVALASNIFAFKFKKWLGWCLIPITFLLTIATVHCHYHYFIDTIFGVVYGLFFYYLGMKIYYKFHKVA